MSRSIPIGKTKAYLIVFDMDDNIDYNDFHNKLVSSTSIVTWWHYLKSSYLIISRESATVLSEHINKIAPKKQYLIMEVNIKNRNGLLPQIAWDWIKSISQQIEQPPNLLF